MTPEEYTDAINESQRLLKQAVEEGQITLKDGTIVALGTAQAREILNVARDLAKQRRVREHTITKAEDFQVRETTDG